MNTLYWQTWLLAGVFLYGCYGEQILPRLQQVHASCSGQSSLHIQNYFRIFVVILVINIFCAFVSFVGGSLIPYGLPCLRELFRFLISLTNPHDRHNTDTMMHMGLQLLTVALESGHIANYQSLLVLVKDELCRHLFQVQEYIQIMYVQYVCRSVKCKSECPPASFFSSD